MVKHSWCLAIVGFFVISFLGPLPAQADSGGESPSWPGTLTAEIGPDADEKWYAIEPGPDVPVRAHLALDNGPHVHLAFQAQDGINFADEHVSPQGNFTGPAEHEIFASHPDGIFSVGVLLLEATGFNVTFTLTIEFDPQPVPECGDSPTEDLPDQPENAFDLGPGDFEGRLGCEGDVADWVRVSPPDAWAVRIMGSTHGGDAEVRLDVRADDLSPIAEIPIWPGQQPPPEEAFITPDPGPVRIGVVLVTPQSDGGPVGYNVFTEFVPPPDLELSHLEIHNVPILQTDTQDIHTGTDRLIEVHVTNHGERRAEGAQVEISVETPSDGHRMTIASQDVVLEPFETITLLREWDAAGQLGDVWVEAEVLFGPDERTHNNRQSRWHYSVIGGTGLGFTHSPQQLSHCLGDDPDGDNTTGLCMEAKAGPEGAEVDADAVVAGDPLGVFVGSGRDDVQEVGVCAAQTSEPEGGPDGSFDNGACAGGGTSGTPGAGGIVVVGGDNSLGWVVFLDENGAARVAACLGSGNDPGDVEGCETWVCAGSQEPYIGTENEDCRIPG